MSTAATEVDSYTEAFTAQAEAFGTALATYRGTNLAADPALIGKVESLFGAYVTIAQEELLPVGERNASAEWSAVRTAKVTPLMKELDADQAELDAVETADAAKNANAAAAGYRSGRTTSIVVMVVGAVLALGLGVLVARRIVASLLKVKDVCDALAAGDLTRHSGVSSRDEPGRMAQALDTAVDNLRRTVHTIDGSATSLAGAAEQMTSTSMQIAESAQEASTQAQAVSTAAEEVSRSVETVSAGGEEMGASIREISQNAAEAARVAAEAVSITGARQVQRRQAGRHPVLAGAAAAAHRRGQPDPLGRRAPGRRTQRAQRALLAERREPYAVPGPERRAGHGAHRPRGLAGCPR
ncbi:MULTISPECIES: methyl-accepting chemotaxis protein [Catenuloplanes]|uniref:Methyl-accepting chemotaxis protein n=1 Tax=Catenuloplanes niger TaxID=587534 RepID=A0AAE3ZL80_9ACTN|nr:methyl-accepting chemotaxis protein [Catenuloplanes niger]MDR7320709.1 methyl-accepting chemotaxis protein [Catenuloplanes niger]